MDEHMADEEAETEGPRREGGEKKGEKVSFFLSDVGE